MQILGKYQQKRRFWFWKEVNITTSKKVVVAITKRQKSNHKKVRKKWWKMIKGVRIKG